MLDEGADGEDGVDEMAEEWDENDMADDGRLAAAEKKKKKAAAASSAKKQKKSSSASSSRRNAAPRAADNDNNDTPAASSPGTRRSTRTTGSRTPRASARHEPVIREDQEENHVTRDDDTHRVDEYNLRRSTRAASDDLNSLSDRMNHFEIKSEAGSGTSDPSDMWRNCLG